MIYLDNAATALRRPEEVTEAVVRAIRTLGSSARGSGSPSLETARLLYRTRLQLASFFGAERPEHVIFTANATEALNLVIAGTVETNDHVVTTVCEHNSVLRPLYRLGRERNVEISTVGLDRQGRLDYAALEASVRPTTKAIIVNHASNVTGTISDLETIGQIARRRQVLLIVDAAQSAGSVPIDCRSLGIDALCFTGHKGLMGPQGTGGVCLSGTIKVRPFKVGGTGSQSRSPSQPSELPDALEAGTPNAHGIAGLSAALAWIEATGVDAIGRRERMLTERFLAGAETIDGLTVYGNKTAADRTAVVSVNLRDLDSAFVSDRLASVHDISTRSGLHCAPLMHRALGTETRGVVRFSFNWFTSEDDIDAALEALRTI